MTSIIRPFGWKAFLVACALALWLPSAHAISVSPDMTKEELADAVRAAVQTGEPCEDIISTFLAAAIPSVDILDAVLDGSEGACDVTQVIISILTERPEDAFAVVARAYYLLGEPAKERIRVAANSVPGVNQDDVKRAVDFTSKEATDIVRDPGGTSPFVGSPN
jgi:hypothetical protein